MKEHKLKTRLPKLNSPSEVDSTRNCVCDLKQKHATIANLFKTINKCQRDILIKDKISYLYRVKISLKS
jgi:hypothetical protein